MKRGVSRNTLLMTAGLVWLAAGANVLRIGVSCWRADSHFWLPKVCETGLVFLLFCGVVFHRLYRRHTRRISQKSRKSCPFSFFDARGWIVMAVMVFFGILARSFHWFPDSFIAVFYTGLSLALIVTGLRFIGYRWRYGRRMDDGMA